ncbi:multiple C2 and transmembrane domain-containing protein-like isoform X2 [Galleria mellonella]|uniref:Multiple C2 and transmembrane domain-containing protein-like isoform X2 n=1 Tax=Galleria mellonella TaxID=7137 RepID=A0A6J1X0P4_GALME|nr:multiple C2 and transmembrane domain-containing protein-like isoform X2 [Galleria mellonella]
MESRDNNALRGKHFSRLHEKIQSKYSEIQRRLEKSKSVESLAAISDNQLFNKLKYASAIDLTENNEMYIDDHNNDFHNLIHSIIVEDVNNRKATLEDVNFKEASISRSYSGSLLSEGYYVCSPKQIKLSNGNNNLPLRIIQLNEIEKGSDDNLTPTTPPARISLRNKIGSRITAVKEKRREEKEKYTKDKKKETKDTGAGLEKLILSNATYDSRLLKRIKLATVTIALIEVTGLDNAQNNIEEKPRNLHCRFKLGTEKCKSKTVKSIASKAKWQELFNLNMYEESMLEVTLWDKDFFIGRRVIDLSDMDKEKTHKINIDLEGEMPNVKLFLLLTITGTTTDNNIYDLGDYEETQTRLETVWYQLDNLTEVGWLSIIVYGAKGLAGNDCYCVLKLGNERLQTYTDCKTNDPNWMKAFTFTITDITSLLEVTVYDEKKNEEVGCITIPLFKINNGHKVWYALKDVTQREQAKGNNPRILLEMRISYNPIKAALRVLKPREIDYLEVEEKFDRRLFTRNWTRTKAIINWILEVYKVIKSSFEWESRKLNTIALIVWLLFHWFYEAWMIPLLLLIPFIYYSPEEYNLFQDSVKLRNGTKGTENDRAKIEKEEKTSIRQKIQGLQELIQNIQNYLGKIATLGESVKNLFNFSVPFLSHFAIICLLGISLIMYLIPVKYLFMAWGIRKYTKKIFQPNRIPHNEILDLLSRVPDDEILLNCVELPLETKEEKL